MNNEKIDARKIDTKAQQEKRNIAMKLREKGMKNLEVADIVGVHHCTISQWYSKYKKDKKLIVVAKRGRVKGSNKRLGEEQESKIIRMLIDTTPEQLKFKFALWTREAVKELIFRELNIELPISTVGDYLAKWQFTSKNQLKELMSEKIVLQKLGLK